MKNCISARESTSPPLQCGHTAEDHAAEIRELLLRHPGVVIPGALDLLVDSIIEQETT